jgi:hypothetical protein
LHRDLILCVWSCERNQTPPSTLVPFGHE